MRKRRLLDAADCLVALPGGTGTFDELWMAVGERGVGCGTLPVLILNSDGYYDGSIAQMKRAHADGLLRHPLSAYFEVVDTPQDAVAWCLKQPRRELPPKSNPAIDAYRQGARHGALVVAAALVVAVGAMRALK